MARIWIADDDFFYRKLIYEALSERGHEVWKTHNGANLIKLLSEGDPDLVILDVFMSQKTGVELLVEMNKMAEASGTVRVPVIMISGDDSKDTEIRVRRARPDAFLLKPFSKEDISRVVYEVLNVRTRPVSKAESTE